MDQGPLVSEQIDAGAAFIREFEKYKPIKSAFWLKQSEDFWYLYLASDQIDDSNFDLAYGEVVRLAVQMNDPNFNAFRVKVVGTTNPIARDVLLLQSRYHANVPIRRSDVRLGRKSIDEVYIYPALSMVSGQ